MTFEHKIVVGLEEIKAIIFQCIECGSRVSLSPENVDSPPNRCPRGHAWDWNVPGEYQTMGSPFVSFPLSLKRLREPLSQRAGFKVFLEFEEPTANAD